MEVKEVSPGQGGETAPGSAGGPLLWALADEWLDERQTLGRGISAATEAAYRRDLTGWAWRIAELGNLGESHPAPLGFQEELARLSLADLTADNVKRALASLAREAYAPASRSRMLAALRGFCGWLAQEGHLSADPTARLENPRPAERMPVAFLSSELEAIVVAVSEPDPKARPPRPRRDRAIVAVLAGAGLRASECAGLRVADVVREAEPYLRVIGKGNKERRVPVAPEVVEAVDDYLDPADGERGEHAPTDPLFVARAGRPYTRESLNYHVYRWLARAGVRKPEGEAAHAFRHTYAKGLVARGVPISSVQKLLGHASLNTTEVYLRMTGAELHEASRAAEVREFLRATKAAKTAKA
ncbi:MAG TPA: tyrosine-type recombinase/integrase [Acidimicrobiales bacterium]|jgi:site-specific recombinase XerD|nr:tyrosine-type recombinase/integrase [Acidimicrobiales bacterium]